MIIGCSFLVCAKLVINGLVIFIGDIVKSQIRYIIGSVLIIGLILSACNPRSGQNSDVESGRLQVVATTTFLGDVIGNIAGDTIDLVVLLEPGQNPHTYQLTPQDMVSLSEADLMIVNGFGLEEFLDEMLEGSDYSVSLVAASEGIHSIVTEEGHHHDEEDGDHEEGHHEEDDDHDEGDHEDGHDHEGEDPHVWLNPNNVIIWVMNITQAFIEKDPENADLYQANADSYIQELMELDTWIIEQLSTIPEKNKKLVSDHNSLTYFADEYGFQQIGAVIPATTTEAETSGKQLAELIEIIRENQIGTIFIGIEFDPDLSQRVAEETGANLVTLYFGSLTDGKPAGTYLDYMRINVEAIVEALGE